MKGMALAVTACCCGVAIAAGPAAFRPDIPKTWDDSAMVDLEVPLAQSSASPVHITAGYYYKIPIRPIFKSYPVYAPTREPAGYFDGLRQKEPERLLTNLSALKTEDDWIRAGEVVFDAPISFPSPEIFRDPAWFARARIPVRRDGTVPFLRYVVTGPGDVRVGNLACALCHTRLMPNDRVVKGAQGNYPFDRAFVATVQSAQSVSLEGLRHGEQLLFGAPWLPNRFATRSSAEITAEHDAIPPGVLARHRSSVLTPVQIPDLIGVKDRRYLDRTGLVRHRGIADMMRYAALNQGADDLGNFGGFVPAAFDFKTRPDPSTQSRYSDEQLYALALYLYSLKPPPSPNKFDALAARGRRVFEREGCGRCHTPPLYTNNRLTPAIGFTVPPEHLKRYDIDSSTIDTDPALTLTTRRGTGYYKVPSLKGVWYRGPFEHNGSVATLEDWFDPRRLDDDYVPTGFKGAGVQHRAVKGHTFGLFLPADDKTALIAFLKTL